MSSRAHIVIVTCLLVAGCASGGPGPAPNLGVDSLAQLGAGGVPSLADYKDARMAFVTGLQALGKGEGGAGKTVKNVSAIAGLVAGLGGTIASLAVKDDDTSAAIAQGGSAVGGVSALVALLVGGDGRSDVVRSYVDAQLPGFEQRWPADRSEPLTAGDWSEFVADAGAIQDVVQRLGR